MSDFDAVIRIQLLAPRDPVERYGTIVIGGGQADSPRLPPRRSDLDFVILTPSRAWATHAPKLGLLRLFTPARYSGLPGIPFPLRRRIFRTRTRLPTISSGTSTASTSHPVEHAGRLASLGRRTVRGARWCCSIRSGERLVATVPCGPNTSRPWRSVSRRRSALHSSAYRLRSIFPRPALVVGAGNSGAQIALELALPEGMARGRDTGHPSPILGRDLFDWICRDAALPRARGLASGCGSARGPERLADRIPERTLAEAGVVRVGRLTDERGGYPVCAGAVIQPSVLVWCTASRRTIDGSSFTSSTRMALHATIAEWRRRAGGLYFLGLRFQHRMTSSIAEAFGDRAAFIAEQSFGARNGLVA